MNVTIIGHSLFAAVLAASLSESGHQVHWCLDDVSTLNIPDPSLSSLLAQQAQAGFLKYVHLDQSHRQPEAIFVAMSSSQRELAETLVQRLCAQLATHQAYWINCSTFGLYGTEQLQPFCKAPEWLYLPDVIQEGNALNSFKQSRQLIVGCVQPDTQRWVQELFRAIFPLPQHYLFMPILDAEFCKLSISGMLATRISYMNDLAAVAEKLNIDIRHVQLGLAADSRIGGSYLSPGAGFGGENFSHDILTLSDTVSRYGVKSRLLEQVWQINQQQKEILFRKLWQHFQGQLQGKTIAIWGAAFKENTANTQFSSTHALLKALWAQGAMVKLHDPQALPSIAAEYGERSDLQLCTAQYQATEAADALCVMTAWKQYYSPNWSQLKHQMQQPLLLDGRNIYDPSYVKSQGFIYEGVGRL